MKLAEAVYEQTRGLGPTPLQGRLNYLHQLGKVTLRERKTSLVSLPQQREDIEFAVRPRQCRSAVLAASVSTHCCAALTCAIDLMIDSLVSPHQDSLSNTGRVCHEWLHLHGDTCLC